MNTRSLLIAIALLTSFACGLPPDAEHSASHLEAAATGGATVRAGSTPGSGSPQNPAACPPTWAEARKLCSGGSSACPSGMNCWYPGVGDALASGGWAPGLLGCFDPSAAGIDAGTAEWRCAQ